MALFRVTVTVGSATLEAQKEWLEQLTSEMVQDDEIKAKGILSLLESILDDIDSEQSGLIDTTAMMIS